MRSVILSVALCICAAASGCDSASCGPGIELVDGECVAPACPEGCGEHEFCNEAAESPLCQCVAGYAGGPCTWAGVVKDGELEDPETWITTKGATILPFDRGLNAGVGLLPASTICNAGGLTQMIDMPRLQDSAPLVAEVVYQAWQVYGLGIGFDGAFTRLPPTDEDEWKRERVCLGEAAYGSADGDAYGGPVELTLSPYEMTFTCPGDDLGRIEVDRVSIELATPEDDCPAVGTVSNGEAEPGQAGWTLEADPPDEVATVEAALTDGVGRDGTGGARLFEASDGGNAFSRMAVSLSIPLATSLPSPAVRFWWKASPGSSFSVDLGTFPINMTDFGQLVGRDSWEQHTYCLPPWTHGSVMDLGFLPETDDLSLQTELVVDEVELVSDDRCGDSTRLFDPSFDSAPNRWPGAQERGLRPSGDGILVLDDEDLARSGRGVLQLTYESGDQLLRFETRVLVPEEEGARLTFWSFVPPETPVTVRSFLGRSPTPTDIVLEDSVWLSNEVCLPSEWAGRWFPVQLRIGPEVIGEVYDPPVRVYFDDFEVSASEGCR